MLSTNLEDFCNDNFENSRSILQKLYEYKKMVIDENEKMNLIGRSTIDDFDQRHLLDCIQIINCIVTNNIWEETLNACTDSHPTRRDFYTREYLKEGRKTPVFDESSTNDYKIINSNRLKKLLNFSFKYANLMEYKKPQ